VPNAVNVAPDGDVIGAKQRLSDAISKLIDPKPETRHLEDGHIKIEWLDSRYQQLCDEIPGSRGNKARLPASSPPLCIDAAELKHEIDTAAAVWEPKPLIDASQSDPPAIAVIRLRAVDGRAWRPQDVRHIDGITATITAWCEAIQQLLNPTPKWTLPSPCPACGTKTVYRINSGGESVRQAALTVGPEGCNCLKCHTLWSPDRFIFLAKVLGYEFTNGICE
jgi:hypothetical protein